MCGRVANRGRSDNQVFAHFRSEFERLGANLTATIRLAKLPSPGKFHDLSGGTAEMNDQGSQF